MWWQILTAGATVAAVLFTVRSEYEKRSLCLTKYEAASMRLPEAFDGLKIMYLADLHSVSFGERNEKLISVILNAKPDLILLGGDMVTVKKYRRIDFKPLSDILTGISGIPAYYGLGNHEARLFTGEGYKEEKAGFLKILADHGVTLLDDGGIDIERKGEKIRLSGLTMTRGQGRKGRKEPMPEEFITSRIGKPESYQILMFHSPLYVKEIAGWGADLALYGHFHGGTVRLPFAGGVMSPQLQFFYRYSRGIFDLGGCIAVVSGGLGTHSVPVRFMNKPEPILIELRRKDRT